MKTYIRRPRKLLPLLLLLAQIVGMGSIKGQNQIFNQSFSLTDEDTGDKFRKMNLISRFADAGWEFNDNCYAIKSDHLMQVGATSGSGEVTTPAIKHYGNVTLLIQTKDINGNAKFTITVSGGGTTSNQEYAVPADDSAPLSAILIRDCTPATRIKITSKGSFSVKNIKAYSIGSAVFYESFDYMVNATSGEFWGTGTATSSICDNTLLSTINACKQGQGSLYIDSESSAKSAYSITSIPVDDGSKVLLQFKIANISDDQNGLTITCDGSARMTAFNSNDISSTSASATEQPFGTPFQQWKPYSVIVTNMSSSTKLTFKGTSVSLNDILITPIPTILDEHADNSTYIKAYAGQKIDVQLDRTLTGDVWCPLCLPFDVTPEVMTAAIGSCEVETLQSIDAGVFKFAAVPSGQPIDAGTPFIVRPAETKENPTFSEVTVKDAEPQTVTAGNTEGYALRGIYSPTELTTDGTNLFLGSNGSLLTLSSDATDRRLGGLRAFFVVPQGTLSARMTTGNAQTSISPATTTAAGAATATYDLTGRRTGGNSRTIIVKQGKKIVGQRNIYK